MQWLDDSDANWTLEWLGLEEDLATFPGYGDGGVDTLVLDIEQGLKVKHSWVTDVIKFRAGGEQRISRNDVDRPSFRGAAYLSGVGPRTTRAKLARYAAIGSVFLLGLPHEALTLRADTSGTSVPVHSAALGLVDWAKPGQRCVVVHRNATTKQLDFVNVVVQSKTSNTIVVDVAPGILYGGWIMPAKAVYPESQQSFARYQTTVESWQLAARAAVPLDFVPTLGQYVMTGIFAGIVLYAREFSLIANFRTIEVDASGLAPATGVLSEGGGFTVFRYQDSVTTVGNFVTAMAAATYLHLTGTPANLAQVITSADDFIAALTGAADSGDVGTGAALTTYAGDGTSRPVWHRRIDNANTNTDGIHAMTQIIDHGGAPYALGTADQADWFRAVVLTEGDQADWQWFKLFMATVVGRQKKFWLATWAPDLTFVSKAANTITVSTTDGSDFPAWWPALREHIQIVETNGTITYAKITAAVDNGNGTRTLTIGVTIATSSVMTVSWLELCRFEDADEYETSHNAAGFDVSLIARVVP